jgi:hypothetical protein
MLPDGRELFMFDAHRGLPCSVDGKRLEIVTRVIGWLSPDGDIGAVASTQYRAAGELAGDDRGRIR